MIGSLAAGDSVRLGTREPEADATVTAVVAATGNVVADDENDNAVYWGATLIQIPTGADDGQGTPATTTAAAIPAAVTDPADVYAV